MTVYKLAEVAGAEPSILGEGFGGRRRILVVTVKDHRSFYQNFADAVLVRVRDLDLGAVHGLADRPDPVIVLVSGGCGAARFRQTVALQDRKSELMEVDRHILIESRS